VKDCEDAGMFFKEVQFVVDTDTLLDVKDSGLVAEFPVPGLVMARSSGRFGVMEIVSIQRSGLHLSRHC
jgi:hypothetical protein